jgi:hypothetical protein
MFRVRYKYDVDGCKSDGNDFFSRTFGRNNRSVIMLNIYMARETSLTRARRFPSIIYSAVFGATKVLFCSIEMCFFTFPELQIGMLILLSFARNQKLQIELKT